MRLKTILTGTLTIIITSALIAGMPAADAAEQQDNGAVVSMRSFSRQSQERKNLLSESVNVESDGSWTMIDSNIGDALIANADRQTAEINARKAAEEKKKQEEAERRAEAEKEKQEAAEAASRNAIRNAPTDSIVNIPTITRDAASSEHGADIANNATKHIGDAMWCTDLASAALNESGISFGVHWPEEYVNVPGAVNIGTDLSDAEPGDLIIYNRTGANGSHNDHISVYIGNGMAVHGGWNYRPDVQLASASLSNGVYTIIRVM